MKPWPATLCVLALPAAAFAAADPPAESGTPFAGSIIQAIAAIIVFVLLMVVLKKMAWVPILKGLQDRENKIRSDLEEAEDSAKSATETLKQYKAQLAQAQHDADRIIEQSRSDALKLGDQLKDQTQSEITAMKQRAANDITRAKEQALADLYSQTATLATAVAGRILQRQINPDDQRELIDQSLAEFKKHRN